MGGVVSNAGGILTGGTSTLGQALGVAQNQAPVQTAAQEFPLAQAGAGQAINTLASAVPIAANPAAVQTAQAALPITANPAAVQAAALQFPVAAAQLPGTTQIGQLPTPLANIAGQQTATAQPLLSTGMNQFQQGAQGQLTPGMEQVVQNALNNANTLTNANYNRMGIGGSTMQAQDLGQNQDQAAQLRANLAAQAEQLGMSAVNEGLGALGQAAGTTMDEASLYSNLANLQLSQNAQMLSALNNLTNAQFTQQAQEVSALNNLTNAQFTSQAQQIGTLNNLASGQFQGTAQELAALNNLTNAQFTSQGQQLSALGALANAQAGQQSNLIGALGNLGSALGNAAGGFTGGTPSSSGGGAGSAVNTGNTFSAGTGDFVSG